MEQPELGGAAFTGSSTNEEVEQLLGDAPVQPEAETEAEVEVVTDQPVTIETTDEVTEAPQTQEELPVAETTDEEPAEEAAPEATPEEKDVASKLFMGQYETPEELEAYALSLRQTTSRQGNELHNLKQQLEERERVLNEVAETIRKNPQLQAMLQNQQTEPEIDPEELLDNPQAVIELAERRAQQAAERRFQELRGELSQQQTAQQQAAQRERAVSEAQAFYSDHPDAVDGTPVNMAMTSLVQNYMQNSSGEWKVDRGSLNTVYELAKNPALATVHDELFTYPDQESLDIAKEALENPRLYKMYRAVPQFLETPEGRELAKEMAQSVSPQKMAQVQQNAQAKQQQRDAAALKAATVETGGNGAPVSGAPGDRPRTEMDDIYDAAMAKKESIFFQ